MTSDRLLASLISGSAIPVKRHGLSGVVASGNGGFSPQDISDLYAWYDANDEDTITKDGSDRVSKWEDKNGTAGYDLVQTNSSYQPLWVSEDQNGKDVINFDANRQMRTASAQSAESMPITIAFVAVLPANDSTQHFGWSEYGGAPSFEKSDVNNKVTLTWTTNFSYTSTSAYNGKWTDMTCLANTGSSSIRFNNTEVATGSLSGTWTPFAVACHGGQPTTANTLWREKIGEICIYNKLLDADELTELFEYFEAKWDL